MKRRHYFIIGICLLGAYIGSYSYFYANARPAANLAYFVFLKGGGPKVQRKEQILYYFFYPVYKVHRLFGGPRHNLDRGFNPNEVYDGDEPK